VVLGNKDADDAIVHATDNKLNLSAANDHELFVRRELLAVVLGQARISAAGNLVVAAITAIVLTLSERATTIFWLWLGALVMVTLARLLLSRGIMPRLTNLDRTRMKHSEHAQTALVALTGLCWGLLSWISYTGENAFLDFYTVAMLIGMASSGTPLLAALPRALDIYLCSALLPTVLRAFLVGGTVSLAGAATVLFAGVVLWNFGRSTHRSLRKSLTLTVESLRLGEALRRERDAVTAAMRAKDLFQAGVTHDLRQPVHALALHLLYLRSLVPASRTDENVTSAWNAVETSLQRISSQLTRLLDMSQLESGELRPVIEELPLQSVFAACQAQFSAQAAAKGLRLRFRRTRAIARSDARMLQSILDNLVSNAVRHTEHGGVLAGVRRRSGHAEIHVYDTGCGIPPEIIPELFVAYRRFDDRSRDRQEGYGLGLALVKKQAQLLGHEISVRSIPNQGSVFRVRVPVADKKRKGPIPGPGSR
jgi:signal transduction histidine kinase